MFNVRWTVVAILGLSLTGCGGKAANKGPGASEAAVAQPETVWTWFVEHHSELKSGSELNMVAYEEMVTVFAKYHADVFPEVAVNPEGAWDLVVSCGGVPTGKSAVERLADAAPTVQGWNVVAFRQPGPLDGWNIEMNKSTLSPTDVRVLVSTADGQGYVPVVMLIPGCDAMPGDTCLSLGYLMLDAALGELGVMTRIGFVEAREAVSPEEMERGLTLAELRAGLGEKAVVPGG